MAEARKMLTDLGIKNFKCFQDTKNLEIRPLTFLVGPNSSGKSSILKMLLMLKQTIDSTDIDNPLLSNGNLIEMGAYPEFIYKGELNRDLEVNFNILIDPEIYKHRIPPNIIEREHRSKEQNLFIKLLLSYNRKTTRVRLKESEIRLNDQIREHLIRGQNRIYAVDSYYMGTDKLIDWHRYNVKPIKFCGFDLAVRRSEKPEKIILEPYYESHIFRSIVESEFRNMFYIGPLRDFPKRIYVASGQAPRDVETRGQRAVDILWFSHRSGHRSIKKIEEEVRYWFKEFAIANDIKLEPIGKGSIYYRLVIIDHATGAEVNFVDIGFGASQTLPIIIQSFYAPKDSILLIEQPEIHLHPKAQSIIGDLFIKAINGADRTFIIETHSEHILARVRRRIAEKQIEKDKVAIYYFEPTEDGTCIKQVTLNDQGQYVDFPKGFFEEDLNEAFEHLKAIQKIRT
jgi:predicted ATPase